MDDLTLKLIPIILSTAAVVLSLYTARNARLDRRLDDLRNFRSQLTDILVKISDIRLQRREKLFLSSDSAEIAREKQRVRAALNDRLRFLCHQADFLTARLEGQVGAIEYALIGLAYEDVGELDAAEKSFIRNLNVAATDKDHAFARRALGRIKFRANQLREGREEFERATRLLSDKTAEDIVFTKAETFRMLAELEMEAGMPSHAQKALKAARVAFESLSERSRRQEGLLTIANMENEQGALAEDEALAKEEGLTVGDPAIK
jgi:tetratricopeptide (TPR) repeat protein